VLIDGVVAYVSEQTAALRDDISRLNTELTVLRPMVRGEVSPIGERNVC
jgi:hypothetical protein